MRIDRMRKRLRPILIYVAVFLIVMWTVVPMIWMFITSLQPLHQLLTLPPHWIPERVTFERYLGLAGLTQMEMRGGEIESPAGFFLGGMRNSLVVAFGTMGICLTFGLLASYAFARIQFRGSQPIFIGIMAMQMLPAIATVIPVFFIMRALHMNDKQVALIMTYSGFVVTYIVWTMTGYLKTLPVELEDAARIDGCSRMSAFFRVTLPLSVPGVIAVGILSFLAAWNEFLFSLVLTSSMASKTMTVVISEFSTRFGRDYGMMMAGGFVASLPPVLLALFFQKYLVRGLSAGAIKG